MKWFAHLGLVFLWTAVAGGQTVDSMVEARDLRVTTAPEKVTIEILFSRTPANPNVAVATKPDRLVLEFPDAGLQVTQQQVAVQQYGVKSVRIGPGGRLGSVEVVVNLDKPLPYELSTQGRAVIVTVLPPQTNAHRSGPVPAASGPLVGALHRTQPNAIPDSSPEGQTSAPNPPPGPPPVDFPESGTPPAAAQNSVPANPSVTLQAPPPVSEGTNGNAQDATLEAPVPAVAPAIAPTPQPNADLRAAFRVKYVAEGIAYLDGGQNDGLAEGMKLVVKEADPTSGEPTKTSEIIADLQVSSVALSSAVTDIQNSKRAVKVGDWAFLSAEDTQSLVNQRSLSSTRKYPTVISFTEGDPLEEEAREEIPRPPLPEINRVRGRIGFDYSGILSHGTTSGNSQYVGMMIRTDITRIGGTYWNLDGYWRGRFGARSSRGQETLQDLINRTYHLQLSYDNPASRWVAGFGRLYLPWATSLDTIDGGYFGARVTPGTTAGIFFGSTPDPTSWSYDPHRQIGGGFINFEGGSYDSFRYTSTSGAGLDLLSWKVDRPFVFFENGLFYKRFLSIYQALQADSPAGNPAVAAPGPGIGRSFTTVRIQPIQRLEFDVNHTYFRDLPTFDPQLIGTGLLDKYLFQGFSFGARVQATKDTWLYTTLGRSNRSGDAKSSLNQLYGVTFARLPWINVRTDIHYSQFNSGFGTGSYESISVSRNFHDSFRWEVLGGRQTFASTIASTTSSSDSSHFVTGYLEAPFGAHYFLQSGYTWNRGSLQNYDQWFFTFGYRFDSRSNHR